MTHIVRLPGKLRLNRRAEARSLCLIGAVAVNASGSVSRDCVIRNLSCGGAQLDVGESDEDKMGDGAGEFFLIDLKHRVASRAMLAWRRQQKAGLKIRQPHTLDGVLPPDIAFLAALFAKAKLRQIDALLAKGFPLTSCLLRAGVKRSDYQNWRQAGETPGETARGQTPEP